VCSLGAASSSKAQTFYSSTFESGAGPEWSVQKTDTTPVGARRFLGQFGDGGVTLSLNALPAHSGLRVSFDLYLIRSWDGNSASAGPDTWSANVVGGPHLLLTTFSNYADGVQSYPATYPGPSVPGLTGATEINTLGYKFDDRPRDAVYHRVFDVYDSAPAIALHFSASSGETPALESWGLDNVRVEAATPPKPPPPNGNIVVNGDFEIPYLVGPGALVTYTAPSTDITGWNLIAGTADLNGLYWENARGRQSMDMSGLDAAGTLRQSLPTTPGKTYVLDFAMAGNPGGPPTKQMEVSWGGAVVDRPTFDNSTATTEQVMGWTRRRYVVSVPSSATGPTDLTFQSLTAGSFGPALDDVRVAPQVPGEAGNNSEFELPAVSGDGTSYAVFEGFEDWAVTDGDVRQVRDGWQAAGGRQFVLLNETEPGTLVQNVPTVAGQAYLLRFAMAADPRGGPAARSMQVFWDEQPVGGVMTFDATGKSRTAMGWERHEIMVTANGTVTTMKFQSQTPGAFGPALDAASAAVVVPGDGNGDGVVTMADAVLALRQITGADAPDVAVQALTDLSPDAGSQGRFHGDGALTFADVVAVLRVASSLDE
jgi:choice-of-anchor C domain-containing protein